MKFNSLFHFAFPLAIALLGVWLIGVNLGGVFAIVSVAAILSPIAASSNREPGPALFAALLTALGVAASSVVLLAHESFTVGQVAAIGFTIFGMSLALAAIVQLLIAIRLSPLLAGAIVTLLALAWLTWPIWLSPWLGFQHSDTLVARLTAIHPLLAINAIAPQFGYWPQSRYLYSLTALSQDVVLSLPSSVIACVVFHALVAVLAIVPIAISYLSDRRRIAASVK